MSNRILFSSLCILKKYVINMKCVFLCICKIVGGRTKPLLEEGVFPLNTIALTSQMITLLVFKIIFYIKYNNFNEFILRIHLNNR